MTIFVSIAAYRDPELIPTIEDCLARARWPGDVRFGICWQHAPGEPRPRPIGPQMRLLDVPFRESQGACWARAEIMKLYDGEDWFLQLDSHHRFVQDWDAKLLDQAERSGSAKPIIGSFGTRFDPASSTEETAERRGIFLKYVMEDGLPMVDGCPLPEWIDRNGPPVRARFLAAGSLFTPGCFVAEVPYDPELYFQGEEITLAIRAFTRGYDLFHPSRHIIWHEVVGSGRIRHWDDHLPTEGVALSWQDRDAASRAKVADFLRRPHIGLFGCGTSRTFAQYEAYAGMNFRRRYASLGARKGHEPALPAPPGAAELKDWKVRIVLDREAMPPTALDRPAFWYVGFHDGDVELARADADPHEIVRALSASPGEIVLERQIRTARPPRSWTVWPTDRRGRWLGKLSGPVDSGCLV